MSHDSAPTDPETFVVPFGRGSVRFRLPPGLSGSAVHANRRDPLTDPAEAASGACRQPIGSARLRDLARGKRRVCIAVTDATRACPDHLLVPPLLAELTAAGVPDNAVTLLIAVGTHRASTGAERRDKLGDDLVGRFHVVDHDASEDDGLVKVMDGPGGVPFRLNRIAVESDLLLSTGVVEPHQYAGFSGGGKTVAIGCADEATIAYTHGPAMLDRPGTRLASLDGNPFQAAVRSVARAAALAFVANAVLDEEGRPVEVAYGAPEPVHDHLAALARELFTVPIPTQVDVAIAGVGYPKDANLYQASRAATYLQFAPTPVVRPGGIIILPSATPEGAGEGAGERRFLAAMTSSDSGTIIERCRRDGIRPGEQRAYIVARMLQDVRVIVAGSESPEVAHSIGFETAPDIESALAQAAAEICHPARVLVVPHALLTLPIVQSSSE